MLEQKRARFLRFGVAFAVPVGTSTYVFLDEDKKRMTFKLNSLMSGPTPDMNTDGLLTYDGDTIVSFEYDGGRLLNKAYKKK